MKKSLICICIFLSSIFITKGQADTVDVNRKNAIFWELLGNGLGYSLNYERVLKIKNNHRYTLRAGFAVYYEGKPEFASPILFNFITGNKHNFECGLGTTLNIDYTIDDKYEINPLITANIGYRYQINNFFFRFNYTPLVEFEDKRVYYAFIWFGTSVGFYFK